jgi:5-deoxy-glucuronate isomerase
MKYNAKNLVIHPNKVQDTDLIVETNPEVAGWEYIHFQSWQLHPGQTWNYSTEDYEMVLVVFSGSISATSNRGEWQSIGKRSNVFAGLPEALYLSRKTNLSITAQTECTFAVAWVSAWRDHPPRLISTQDVTVELRGGDNVSRQINGIIRPGFDCDRLVVVEVLTPGGNWSSYPPHKHDVHQIDENGNLLEADLEEIYYYKIDKPEGYAFQRIYTGENSPLQKAGEPIDEVVILRDGDLVIIPEGYHPVTSAPGYTTYYLNVLSGSAQALTAVDDPNYAWVKETYRSIDSRLPLYPVDSRQRV